MSEELIDGFNGKKLNIAKSKIIIEEIHKVHWYNGELHEMQKDD